MKILVLSVNYWPEETGIGPLTTWRCEYLASRGHEVTVCTTLPYYPQWRVYEPYKGRFWRRESHNGVSIIRSWSWIPKRLTSKRRILFEATFLLGNLIAALRSGRPDLVLVESPPLGFAFTAGFLKRFWRVPFVYDVMDLQPDAAADLGMLQDGILIRSLYRIEKFAYNQAALVSTLTEGMRRRILEKSIAPEKVSLFAARADSALLELERGVGGRSFRQAHELEGKFIVLYTGNMGVKQGLNVILSSAQLSQDRPEIVYLFAGDGAMRRDTEAQAAALKLANVRFLPVQPREQLFQMLTAADLCLITQQRSVSDIVFPSRTATFMAAGCPVIASVNSGSAVASILQQSGAGLVIAPEQPMSLFRAITSLQDDSERRTDMSEAGRRFAREYWDENVILPKLESELIATVIGGTGKNVGSTPSLDFDGRIQ
jgi:colanic acid biosynthesis glycosyl transferase WcaI